MNNKFTKADLKTGDVVKFGDGELGIVITDLEVIATQNGGWIDFQSVTNDLTSTFVKGKYDIVAVRRPNEKPACSFDAFGKHRGILVYERNKVEDKSMVIYYIRTSDDAWCSSIKGYYSTIEKAKENMCHFSDWYRANGTGKIYEITLDTNETRLVYEK